MAGGRYVSVLKKQNGCGAAVCVYRVDHIREPLLLEFVAVNLRNVVDELQRGAFGLYGSALADLSPHSFPWNSRRMKVYFRFPSATSDENI